ncbi:MAG: hypothetical protein NC823_00610 [Candidatus Omnitrophica bacterium]|nr:hypothetical protein [Candidatus Omnitrophota bacterium]
MAPGSGKQRRVLPGLYVLRVCLLPKQAGRRRDWLFPHNPAGWCLAPETPWADLLCERVREFLGHYPVDWILFDMFLYGDPDTNAFKVQPAAFVEKPFREIIGRPMSRCGADIP